MQDLQIFKNDSFGEVRTLSIEGEPWFVAKDVAEILGYTNTRKAILDHCKGGNETVLPSAGGNQIVKIIPERDVYRLIMRSKMPKAEQFEEWVVGEVLPSIRKTGSYTAVPRTFADALQLAADQQRAIEAQQAQIEHMKPAVQFYDDVTGSKDALSMDEVAKIIDKGIGRNKLFALLRSAGILMQNNTPYQKYVDAAFFRVVEQKYMKGSETHINIKTLVYQKGVDMINKIVDQYNKIAKRGSNE